MTSKPYSSHAIIKLLIINYNAHKQKFHFSHFSKNPKTLETLKPMNIANNFQNPDSKVPKHNERIDSE